MNLQKFTQKSLEALKDAQTLMASKGNSQITQEHLMLALIDGEGGIAADLIRRAGASVEVMRAELSSAVDESPRMTGGSVEADKIYISRELESALAAAETIASKMKDEYVSVEHIILGILDKPSDSMRKILKNAGLERGAFEKAVKEIRGSQRVTNDNPEETYDALGKYGQDLTALARNQKLLNRRTGRRKNRNCGGPRYPNCAWGRTGKFERPYHFFLGYGRADCRCEISRRV